MVDRVPDKINNRCNVKQSEFFCVLSMTTIIFRTFQIIVEEARHNEIGDSEKLAPKQMLRSAKNRLLMTYVIQVA